jgi:catechol 2,3-dioxygenase-like lactoylglutathione lyase family enzyme
MPQIRHLALLTDDQEGLATFYKSVFEMHEVHRHPSPHGGPAIYLSDGHLNLAILPAAGRRKGIFHFGMAVDDVEKTAASAIAAGATPPNETLPADGRFAETFVFDPAGTRVDISPGWKH